MLRILVNITIEKIKLMTKQCQYLPEGYHGKTTNPEGYHSKTTKVGNGNTLQITCSSCLMLKSEVLSRVEQTSAALIELKLVWRNNNISLGWKVYLMHSLVICITIYAVKMLAESSK